MASTKLSAAVLAGLLTATLAACGSNDVSTGTTPATSSTTAAPAPGAAAPATTPAPPGQPTASPAAADGAINTAAKKDDGNGGDAVLIVLAILAGLLLLAALAYAIARYFAWEPHWLPRARHSWGEAGWRASNTWSEFTDWVRFGR